MGITWKILTGYQLAIWVTIHRQLWKMILLVIGNKAPGPDGMTALFFQHYWPIMEADICKMVLNFLNNGIFLRKFNFTLITLIPKVERPVSMAQFRPIALCNTVAKIIAKTMALRLKKVMPTIISDTQCLYAPHAHHR
ncbi:hypothetical protein LIER_24144 [Lithospermum erythrorhizon]|uniref:Reverse transcriptase domain-containing protein n=1 Tax=Lithospermum erythrorhizon TaxID=34254 RepID=A0AAV3R438_LITER